MSFDFEKSRIEHGAACIYVKDLPDVDWEKVQIGDWVEGLGNIDTYAILGFFHHLGKSGFKIVKPERP